MHSSSGRVPARQQIPHIVAELQIAADTLQEIQWGVSVFGSARLPVSSPYYALAQTIGQRLAQAGLTVIAGGGPGLMEAANKGAFEAHGRSVGLNIRLPHESYNNPYQTHSLHFNYFYSRKATFFMHSAAYIALPGGFGTLDELLEVLTLLQTGKIPAAPVVLVGVAFWSGMVDWFKTQLLALDMIAANDLDLFVLTDDVDVVMQTIQTHCARCATLVREVPALPE